MIHQVLLEGQPRRDDKTRERLAEAALASSIAERRAMEVERAIVDLYRTFLMKSRIGDRFQGTVTAVVGSGVFVQLDSPFVDVLIRLEDLGHDHWEVDDDALRVVAVRSGDMVALGDRLLVEVTDAAIFRRTVYAKRIGNEGAGDSKADERRPEGRRPPSQRGKPERNARPAAAAGPQQRRGRGDGRKPAPAAGGRSAGPGGRPSAPGVKGKKTPAPAKGGKGKGKSSGGGSKKGRRR